MTPPEMIGKKPRRICLKVSKRLASRTYDVLESCLGAQTKVATKFILKFRGSLPNLLIIPRGLGIRSDDIIHGSSGTGSYCSSLDDFSGMILRNQAFAYYKKRFSYSSHLYLL